MENPCPLAMSATTLQSLLDGLITSPKTSTYRIIERIEVPDDKTIVFHLKEPNAAFLWNLTNGGIGIVPEGAGSDFQKKPIGTGPFRFVSYAHEEEVVLAADPDYFRGPPTVRRVSFKVIPDATTRALELRKGSVDIGRSPLYAWSRRRSTSTRVAPAWKLRH